MKKAIALAAAFMILFASTAFAGGDQNHGSKGQGSTGTTGQGSTSQTRGN